jgi:hypothetical protein
MNVVASTRMEVEYAFKLSQADFDRYMADPWAWRDEVQAQLKANQVVAQVGGDAVPATKRAKPGPRSQTPQGDEIPVTIGRGRKTGVPGSRTGKTSAKNGHGRQPTGHRKTPAGSSSLKRSECPICHEMITQKYMPLHQRTKHGQRNGSAPSPSPEAAGAAV